MFQCLWFTDRGAGDYVGDAYTVDDPTDDQSKTDADNMARFNSDVNQHSQQQPDPIVSIYLKSKEKASQHNTGNAKRFNTL